jgi:DNA-binding FrmR family transcriptional regulator
MKRQKETTALKKARGMIEKILKMVEEDKYCIDIIQQNLATIGLLKSVNEQLLEGHLHCCFKSAMESTDEERKEEMIQELIKMLRTAQKK